MHKKYILLLLMVVLLASGVCVGGEIPRQKLVLSEFMKCLLGLEGKQFRQKVTLEEMYRLKRNAEPLDPNESWPAILQLWVSGEFDYVQLLWWRKDDTETRAFIVSLEWCMVSVPKKGGEWPCVIDDYEGDALRFDKAERDLRIREAAFVRENYALLARELSIILAASKIDMAKRYQTAADVQVVDEIELVESLVPKDGEPEPDGHAAAIVALGRRAGPFLVEKILDGRDSKVLQGGQFKICDVANDLLCDIYHKDPAEALIRRKPPLDAGQGYYFRDHMVLTDTRQGREELHAAWKKIIEEAGHFGF